MSETVDNSITCVRAERDDALGCDPQQLVDVLSDETARAVYLSLDEPATVATVAERLDLSQSTAYRKVEQLEDAGLITHLNRRSRGGVPAHYVQLIDRVTVTYDDPLEIECNRNGQPVICKL